MTQVSNDTIAAAIAAAGKVAAETPMPGAQQGGALVQSSTSAVAPLAAGRPRSLDDAIDEAGAAISVFLANEPGGFRFGSSGSTVVPQIKGELDLANGIRVLYALRFNSGGGTKFLRSLDGVRELGSGRPWADVVNQAQQLDQNCKGQYDCAEIAVKLTEPVLADGKTYESGTIVGITTPVTGYKPFMAWLKGVRATAGKDAVLSVLASTEAKTKPGVKAWGVPKFDLVQ